MLDLRNHFERVFVISLDHRHDRWDHFMLRASKAGVKGFSKFRAIDGRKCPPPMWFRAGAGAWGCLQSHLRIAQDAMQDGLGRYLVLEDDVVFRDGFAGLLEGLMGAIGDDEWDQLYLGGYHMKPPVPVSEQLVLGTNINRAHAYAVRAPFLPAMTSAILNVPLYLSKVTKANGPNQPEFGPHFDHMLGYLHERGQHRILAARRWLCGQAQGRSNIIDANLSECYWDASDA